MNKIITITRQYGSGGREIGQKLAEKLGIKFYDHELISRAAKESGFSEVAFEKAEQKASHSLLYSLVMGMNSYGNQDFGFSSLSLDDKIFLAQSDVIRKVASEGACVIVGRCADYILKEKDNVVSIFLQANLQSRIKRVTQLYDLSEQKAAEEVLKMDKKRANYYNYHTNEKWGFAGNYDMVLRTDLTTMDQVVDLITNFVEMVE